VNAADIQPVEPSAQRQSLFDLFLIFIGANVVATTFQTGASLASSFSVRQSMAIIGAGSIVGSAFVAVLAPLGPRLRVPSVIAVRPALGIAGAGLVAAVLYISNFAWIALNNVIAASACAKATGWGSETAWSVALGVIATAVVWKGPRAVALADRVAVPLMLMVGVLLTIACLHAPPAAMPIVSPSLRWWRGLDVVVGYQVSWILMFADYSRYSRSARGAGWIVFAGLAATSLWMMPLGAMAATAAASSDPGAMMAAVGLGVSGALLLTLATLTTNFVNIYMSSLAWKSLVPSGRDSSIVWSIGIVGTALGAVPGVWLDQYTNFMIVLGAVLLPIGGILVAHYYLRPEPVNDALIAALYDNAGRFRGYSKAGLAAWAAGAIAFFAAGSIGGTLPAFAVSMVTYGMLRR
jgi:NCS1 family nucleobase:cation symporter-1